ncbi:MAG TPA: Holliday junction resolvase RuvX [Candidatus Saccharimonadales bacterium]|nr:Holliday junction resolvase RuvX [Candidatus Saccharimonadales bacterium]
MSNIYLGLDIGERRIGVATATSEVRAAWPLTTVLVNDDIAQVLKKIVDEQDSNAIIVGRPLNQAGQPTKQTKAVEQFVHRVLKPLGVPIHWQEESVTSILAEERLQERGQPYDKAAIDAEAAAIILQDYLEAQA